MPTIEVPELLCQVNFPLYQACMISPRHILFAGGGGAAKTGVHNGFEIFEISHDGDHCVAESVKKFSTGEFAVMNISAGHYDVENQTTLIAVGQDESCQLYSCQLARSISPPSDGEKESNLRRRNGSAVGKVGHVDDKSFTFDLKAIKSVQTDFSSPEPYQKVVRISCDNKLMATGGDDGVLRVWTFPDLNPVHEIDAHDKEIDDIEFSPDSTKVISISKDRRALVWDVKKGKKHAEMGWDTPSGVKYAYKRMRCGCIDGNSRKYKVFTIVNPVAASKPPSFVQRWDPKSFTIEQSVAVEGGSLSAMAVSSDGNFVATGAMFDGTVEIYIAYSLTKVKRIEKCHSTFITGMEFLPSSEETDAIRGFSDASVVSISVDHQVCIHHIPRLRKISMGMAAAFIVLCLLATFVLCSFLGL